MVRVRWAVFGLMVACGGGAPDAEATARAKAASDKAKAEAAAEAKSRSESARDPLQAKGLKNEVEVTAARTQLKIEPGDKLFAKFDTTQGLISCELWPEKAPETVVNFVGLAEGTKEWQDPTGSKVKKPLYDGTRFHRVIDGFMIQGGDPYSVDPALSGRWGTGGPGYKFKDEIRPDVTFDRDGLLAMANAGPGTNGSQFFITVSKPTYLNGRHTIFGACDLPVVQAIAKSPVIPPRNVPVQEVVVKKVLIERVKAAATTPPTAPASGASPVQGGPIAPVTPPTPPAPPAPVAK
jgi:peptidyl-prolyl cis-trans isomerase A (cyclophilin A)